ATLHTSKSARTFEKSYLGTALAGEGGVVSTVDDMLRWLAHWDRPKMGSAETWQALSLSQKLANGRLTGYGCGLITARYRGLNAVSHGGGVLGGNAHILKIPSHGLDVVVILNRDDFSAAVLANRIVDSCISDLEPAVSVSTPRLLRGAFHSPTTGRLIQ